MRREWFTLGIHLGYRYDGSPICWPDGTPGAARRVRALRRRRRGPAIARRTRGWPTAARRSTCSAAASCCCGCETSMPRQASRIAEAAQQRGVPLSSSISPSRTSPTLYESKFVLVRPDGHVCWRGDARRSASVIDACARHRPTRAARNRRRSRKFPLYCDHRRNRRKNAHPMKSRSPRPRAIGLAGGALRAADPDACRAGLEQADAVAVGLAAQDVSCRRTGATSRRAARSMPPAA